MNKGQGYLFIGGVADGRRIAIPNLPLGYRIPKPRADGSGYDTAVYLRHHLGTGKDIVHIYVENCVDGKSVLQHLIDGYQGAKEQKCDT